MRSPSAAQIADMQRVIDAAGFEIVSEVGTAYGTASGSAALAGWPTPMAGTPAQKGYNEAGNTDSSRKTVELASWATPTRCDHQGAATPEAVKEWASRGHNLPEQAQMANWATPATPATRDWKSNEGSQEFHAARAKHVRGKPLSEQTHQLLTGWATPVVRDHRNSGVDGTNPRDLPRQAFLTPGPTSTGSSAATARPGQLNAAFPRWLQGYPKAWCQAAIDAWHSTPTKARKRA